MDLILGWMDIDVDIFGIDDKGEIYVWMRILWQDSAIEGFESSFEGRTIHETIYRGDG